MASFVSCICMYSIGKKQSLVILRKFWTWVWLPDAFRMEFAQRYQPDKMQLIQFLEEEHEL